MARIHHVPNSVSCNPRHTFRRDGAFSPLPDTAFHLELDQSVHLDRVLHRQFLRERLDEAHDDHLRRFGFGQAAAHQVEELLLGHFGDRRFVLQRDVVVHDFVVRNRIGRRLFIQNERVALDVGFGAFGIASEARPDRDTSLCRRVC